MTTLTAYQLILRVYRRHGRGWVLKDEHVSTLIHINYEVMNKYKASFFSALHRRGLIPEQHKVEWSYNELALNCDKS